MLSFSIHENSVGVDNNEVHILSMGHVIILSVIRGGEELVFLYGADGSIIQYRFWEDN